MDIEPQQPDTLILLGASRDISIVPQSLSSLKLLTALRERDREAVLVPYVDLSIHFVRQSELQEGTVPNEILEREPTVARTIGLENALWLTFDMLRDLSLATGRLASTAPDGLRLDISRLQLARLFAEQAQRAAGDCVSQIEELLKGSLKASSGATKFESAGKQEETPKTRRRSPRKATF